MRQQVSRNLDHSKQMFFGLTKSLAIANSLKQLLRVNCADLTMPSSFYTSLEYRTKCSRSLMGWRAANLLRRCVSDWFQFCAIKANSSKTDPKQSFLLVFFWLLSTVKLSINVPQSSCKLKALFQVSTLATPGWNVVCARTFELQSMKLVFVELAM